MPQMEAPRALLEQIQIFFAPGTVIPPSAPGLERKNETKKTEDLLIFSLSVNPPFSIFNQPLMTLYSAESEELSSSVFAASSAS